MSVWIQDREDRQVGAEGVEVVKVYFGPCGWRTMRLEDHGLSGVLNSADE